MGPQEYPILRNNQSSFLRGQASCSGCAPLSAGANDSDDLLIMTQEPGKTVRMVPGVKKPGKDRPSRALTAPLEV